MNNIRDELNRRMREASEKAGLEVIEKTIPFLNNDVPKFLEGLRKFEEWSRKTGGKTMVCYQKPYKTKVA